MAFFNTPSVPIFTYDSGLSDVTVTITDGIQPETITLAAPSRTLTAGDALVAALNDYNTLNPGSILSIGLTYTNSNGVLTYRITITGPNDIDIIFPAIGSARIYGINTTTATIQVGLLTPFSNTINFAGHWTPYCLTLKEQQNNISTIVATDALTYSPVNVIQWGANTQYVNYEIYYCKAANIFDYRAADPNFYTAAGRTTSADIYNTYEKFIEGVRADGQGRAAVWYAEDPFNPASFTIDTLYQLSIYQNLDSLLENLEDVSSGRLWHVKFGARILF